MSRAWLLLAHQRQEGEKCWQCFQAINFVVNGNHFDLVGRSFGMRWESVLLEMEIPPRDTCGWGS